MATSKSYCFREATLMSSKNAAETASIQAITQFNRNNKPLSLSNKYECIENARRITAEIFAFDVETENHILNMCKHFGFNTDTMIMTFRSGFFDAAKSQAINMAATFVNDAFDMNAKQ